MNDYPSQIRIGTRGSPLALAQTHMVRTLLEASFPDVQFEVVVILTSGDWAPQHGEVPLSEAKGGKAQFAKEIEEALLRGEIDMAVHSMKDMDSCLPEGLVIEHMLPRQDVRDALIFNSDFKKIADFSQKETVWNSAVFAENLSGMPGGVRIGTSSVRRAAWLRSLRGDIAVVPLRGNVQTRLDKLQAGQVDVTLLAMAGLNRLNMAEKADIILGCDAMLPAAGQGAVGIEIPVGSQGIRRMLDGISCFDTIRCVKAERAAVRALGGSCRSPIGAYALIENGLIKLKIAVLAPDGSAVYREDAEGAAGDIAQAEALGREAGEALRQRIPSGLI